MKTKKVFGLEMNLLYTKWHRYIVEQSGDLRALDMDTADTLLDMAIERNDNEMIESIELFMGE